MNLCPAYSPQSSLPVRFISLAWEGVKSTPTKEHDANLCEKLGNGLLYVQENAPRQIKNLCTNPQAITTTIFVVAHLANSYAFYPQATTEVLEFVASVMPEISSEMVRFTGWSTISVTITGLCARAHGRLTENYIASLTNNA